MFKTKKKVLNEEQLEVAEAKDFFDMAVPGHIRFYPEYYVCGNFYKSCWAVTEYPPTTEENAILAHLADHSGVNMRIYCRYVDPSESRKIVQAAVRKNHMMATANDVNESIRAQDNIHDVVELISELRRNKEPLLHCSVFIELRATSLDKLKELQDDIQMELQRCKAAGAAIEAEMANLGVADQTIKAQLIYMSFFENVANFDANAYAHLFSAAPDDAVLINAINTNYGLNIVYEDYVRTYTFVMNSTVNQYMFTDASTKNAADLAAWADNAFISGWGYMPGYFGDKNPDERIRYCDNAGLMLGYLNYDPAGKTFTEAYSSVTYTVQGELSTMPDVPGIGLYDGAKLGIYIGSGQAVYCDQDPGYVTKQAVSDGAWTSWCTFEGITYPQTVQDAIDALVAADNSADDDSSTNE